MTGRWCVKAIRGEEEQEEEEDEVPLGDGAGPQKPDLPEVFRVLGGDGIPAKNHVMRVRSGVQALHM